MSFNLYGLRMNACAISSNNLDVPVSYQDSIDFLYRFRHRATLISDGVMSVKIPEPSVFKKPRFPIKARL
jgi:hypothetical protein